MGFVTSTGDSNSISGLINMLSNPEAAVQALKELDIATKISAESQEKADKARFKLKEVEDALSLKQASLDQKEADLALHNKNLVEAREEFDGKVYRFTNEEQAFEVEKIKFSEDIRKTELAFSVKEKQLAERERVIELKNAAIEKRNMELELRDQELMSKYNEAKVLELEYKTKLAKLKALV